MNEPLLSDAKSGLEKSFVQLKKYSELMKKNYKKVIDENFGEENWKKEGKKIDSDIKMFDKHLRDVNNKLKSLENEKEDEDISKVKTYLEDIQENVIDMEKAMKEKIKQFNINVEMEPVPGEGDGDEGFHQKEIYMDLSNNKEVLEQRRKELEEIHKTAAILKDTTDKMAQDVEQQGAILDEVENNVIEAKNNAEKAKKEITKADEISRGNSKRLYCLICIVLVAIGGITAIIIALIPSS